jgi:hypothetical protein
VLNQKHLTEWLNSGVDSALIELNVRSIDTSKPPEENGLGTAIADDPHQLILYSENLQRHKTGRLSESVVKRYRHLNLGWWCAGLNALTLGNSQWGCFKPDHPRITEDGKAIKYEHPPKESTELFVLRVTRHIWRAVAKKAKLECPDLVAIANEEIPRSFWQWVKDNPEVPITITEGAKKTGSLLSHGYVAIGLPGIYGGYRSKDAEGNPLIKKELIPQLQVFLQPGREFVFCFDNDPKPSTRKAVRTAIANCGNLLSGEKRTISVMEWRQRVKGIDDLIMADGEGKLDQIFTARVRLEAYKLAEYYDISPLISHRFNSRYLNDLVAPEAARLIGLQSPKGTGKTEWLAQQAAIAMAQGIPVIVITHREQLGKELGNRLGLEYRTELTRIGKNLGYVLCIDSLHPKATPPFNSESWHDALVILDEAEQIIWHGLNSDTCKFNRPAILGTLTELLGNASKIILSDADLSKISLTYINGLLPEPVTPWVAVNSFTNSVNKIAFNYEKPESCMADLIAAIAKGEKVIIHTGGQRASSQWGTINIEKCLKNKFPSLKILRIDAETVSEKGHPAFGIIGNLNAVLPLYDIVIASPTLETGVSIDINHFDRVFGFATGSQTVSAVCQSLARVRADIPRHIWAKPYSNQRIGNGSTDPKLLIKSQQKLFQDNLVTLGQTQAIAMDSNNPQHLSTWATMSAIQNSGFKNYRESILDKLQSEGYEIKDGGDPDDGPEVKADMREAKEANYLSHCEDVANSPILTEKEYQEVSKARAKTPQERLAQKATEISRRYATQEISPAMVADDDGGLYPKLRLHYFLTVGRNFVKASDRRRVDKLTEDTGSAFSPDVNGVCLTAKVRVMELVNIQQFFSGEHTSESLQAWFDELVKVRRDIKIVLGMSINPERDTPIAVAQRLLGLLGLKMTGHQHRLNGKRIRTYTLTDDLPPERVELFTRWLERDFARVPFEEVA